MTYVSRIEAVWIVKFRFQPSDSSRTMGKEEQHPSDASSSSAYGYSDLSEVLVTPRFPSSKDEEPDGLICRGLEKCMDILMKDPNATLTDLFNQSSAGSSRSPPPGFELLVRYVDGLCLLHGRERVQPHLVFSSSLGGVLGSSSVDLTPAEVVHMGKKSAVFRLPGQDSVIKVSNWTAIKQELQIHGIIDRLNCPNLRPLLSNGHGEVKGSGDGLGFLHLSYWCETVPKSGFDDRETYLQWWSQVSYRFEAGLVLKVTITIYIALYAGGECNSDFACQPHLTSRRQAR